MSRQQRPYTAKSFDSRYSKPFNVINNTIVKDIFLID